MIVDGMREIGRVAIFFDGFNVHKCTAAADLFVAWGWLGMLNVAYKPEYNPMVDVAKLIQCDYRKLAKSPETRGWTLIQLIDFVFKMNINHDFKPAIRKCETIMARDLRFELDVAPMHQN